MQTILTCNTVAECSAFFVRDCIRRAELIEAKLAAGHIEPHNVAWAKAKAETYRAEAAEELRHA